MIMLGLTYEEFIHLKYLLQEMKSINENKLENMYNNITENKNVLDHREKVMNAIINIDLLELKLNKIQEELND